RSPRMTPELVGRLHMPSLIRVFGRSSRVMRTVEKRTIGNVKLGMLGLLTAVLLTTSSVTIAHAGCGCGKPPPPPNQLLPNVAPAGTAMRILHPSFAAGQRYRVRFTSATGGAAADVTGTVAVRRDLADTKPKPQLVVALPTLPLGPASLAVYDATTN